jgi:hypothetical protein
LSRPASPALRRTLAAALFASLAVSGCRCGPTITKDSPDYQPSPTALSFEACPTKDSNGVAVKDVFPDTKKVTIENAAKVGSGLALSITGADSAAFTLPTTGLPTTIDRLSSVEIPVSFSPTKAGDMRATLVIDDQFDGTDNKTVTLVGTGKNLPAQATIETAPQSAGGTYTTCTPDSPLSDCTMNFPDTLFGQEASLKLKIRNKGCPTLKVTALGITTQTAGDDQGFSISSPAQLPSSGTPMTLNFADGTDEVEITVKFAPVDNGAGSDGLRSAVINIVSNDQLYGDGQAGPGAIVLQANAVKPSLYVTPTVCDFSNPNDTCGNTSKIADQGDFRITNDGTTDVRIDSVKFASTNSATSGSGGRFTIATSIEGQTIAQTQSKTVTVTHHDQPIYVGDKLVVSGTIMIGGVASGSAGSVSVALFGGRKPCLTTDPADTLNFNNPATELSAQSVTIRNCADAGTLIIQSVGIDPNPFFSLIDPLIPANTQVASGQSIEATVQYKRPASGGIQLGTMRITTNDSDYAPAKIINLASQSPLDQIPVAVLTACRPDQLLSDPQCAGGAQNSMSVQYSALTTKEITFSGAASYDPDPAAPGGSKPPVKYKFTLLPGAGGSFPPGVTTQNLANNGTQITTATTKLTIPSGGIGTYRVALVVYDDRAQASANSAVLSLSVYP